MNDNLKDNLIRLGVVATIIIIVILCLVFHALYVAPNEVTITTKDITNKQIPESFDDLSIAYISDIHYKEFTDKERFNDIIDKIKVANPDVILFGGDLFTNWDLWLDDKPTMNYVKKQLKSLKAPLGKFFVLGDDDLKNSNDQAAIEKFFYKCDFENLTNRTIDIYNKNQDSIQLTGIDNMANGTPDLNAIKENLDTNKFNLMFTHTPDIATKLSSDEFDLLIGGQSNGGQVRLPFVNIMGKKIGANTYKHGTYDKGNSLIYVSDGAGTTRSDARFLTKNEIVIFRLYH